jgi:hypothetical protein
MIITEQRNEGMRNEAAAICLKGLRKTNKSFRQGRQSPDEDLNLGLPNN